MSPKDNERLVTVNVMREEMRVPSLRRRRKRRKRKRSDEEEEEEDEEEE